MINVFIGYDSREAVAYSVLAYSIQARASQPVSTSTIPRVRVLENMVRRARRDAARDEPCDRLETATT
jgi:hypothetical protein